MRFIIRVGLVALLSVGCASFVGGGPGAEPEDEGTAADEVGEGGERPVDLFREGRGVPDAPIDNEEQAIAAALAQTPLLAHLKTIDARYHPRRQKGMAWTARAQPSGDQASWQVELRANAHQSSADYLCTIEVTRAGEALVSDPPSRSCRWEAAR